MRYRVLKSIPLPAAAATGAPENEAKTSADSQLSFSQRNSPNPDSAVGAKAGGATTCLPYPTPSDDDPCSVATDELCVTKVGLSIPRLLSRGTDPEQGCASPEYSANRGCPLLSRRASLFSGPHHIPAPTPTPC